MSAEHFWLFKSMEALTVTLLVLLLVMNWRFAESTGILCTS
jgi:hypothetical protein